MYQGLYDFLRYRGISISIPLTDLQENNQLCGGKNMFNFKSKGFTLSWLFSARKLLNVLVLISLLLTSCRPQTIQIPQDSMRRPKGALPESGKSRTDNLDTRLFFQIDVGGQKGLVLFNRLLTFSRLYITSSLGTLMYHFDLALVDLGRASNFRTHNIGIICKYMIFITWIYDNNL